MSELGLVPEKTFATNLIFVESRNVAEIKTEIRNDGLFDHCWRVHVWTEAKPQNVLDNAQFVRIIGSAVRSPSPDASNSISLSFP
jgi:hypothetical protein